MTQTPPTEPAVAFRWMASELRPVDDCDAAPSAVRVADSFLVADDRVFALEMHRTRFANSARAAGFADVIAVARFWEQSLNLIPAEGNWFPRFELVTQRAALRLQFRLRPSPARRDEVRLWTYRGPELRRTPEIKGPDLAAMMGLRSHAQQAGADEAVILDQGRVTDGATSALLWWRGGVLCGPPPRFARVDSVLARSIRAIAEATATETRDEASEPEALAGCEVWAVNALHGIRVATQWVEGPELRAVRGRAHNWRRRLEVLTRKLARSDGGEH